jgi:hypothetical protein
MAISDELFTTICDRVAAGESLRSILRADAMPRPKAFYALMTASDSHREQYARAREDQAEALADEILDVARAASNATWGQDRLLIDALKWHASKLKPKVYGDKQHIEHSGQVEVASAIVAARKRSG